MKIIISQITIKKLDYSLYNLLTITNFLGGVNGVDGKL